MAILTGRLDLGDEDFKRLGAFAALPKPFTAQQVLDIVEKGVGLRTRRVKARKDSGKSLGK